jgi:hypothetical protein
VPRLLGVHLVHLRVANRRSPHEQHPGERCCCRDERTMGKRREDSSGDVGTI